MIASYVQFWVQEALNFIIQYQFRECEVSSCTVVLRRVSSLRSLCDFSQTNGNVVGSFHVDLFVV